MVVFVAGVTAIFVVVLVAGTASVVVVVAVVVVVVIVVVVIVMEVIIMIIIIILIIRPGGRSGQRFLCGFPILPVTPTPMPWHTSFMLASGAALSPCTLQV